KNAIDHAAEEQMQTVIDLVTAVRNIRAQWNIKNNQALSIQLSANSQDSKFLKENESLLKSRANILELNAEGRNLKPKKRATTIVGRIKISIPLEGIIDIEAEKKRIKKQIETQKQAAQDLAKRLSHEGFLAKAPEEVIAKEKARLKDLEHEV